MIDHKWNLIQYNLDDDFIGNNKDTFITISKFEDCIAIMYTIILKGKQLKLETMFTKEEDELFIVKAINNHDNLNEIIQDLVNKTVITNKNFHVVDITDCNISKKFKNKTEFNGIVKDQIIKALDNIKLNILDK